MRLKFRVLGWLGLFQIFRSIQDQPKQQPLHPKPFDHTTQVAVPSILPWRGILALLSCHRSALLQPSTVIHYGLNSSIILKPSQQHTATLTNMHFCSTRLILAWLMFEPQLKQDKYRSTKPQNMFQLNLACIQKCRNFERGTYTAINDILSCRTFFL